MCVCLCLCVLCVRLCVLCVRLCVARVFSNTTTRVVFGVLLSVGCRWVCVCVVCVCMRLNVS